MADTTVIDDGRHAYRPQSIGRVFGWFFLATFLTSIPAYFIGYAKMLDNPASSRGAALISVLAWQPGPRLRSS